MMISKVSASSARGKERINFAPRILNAGSKMPAVSSPLASPKFSSTSLLNALQGYNGIRPAVTVNFGKGSLFEAFDELTSTMYTCRDLSAGIQGENVGINVPVSKFIERYADQLPKEEDAVKTNIDITVNTEKNKVIDARTQLKKQKDGILYEMAVRPMRTIGTPADKRLPLTQLVQIKQEKEAPEKTYVLITKGNLMAVAEDGENILLTNAGGIHKLNSLDGNIDISVQTRGNKFRPFNVKPQRVMKRTERPSLGEGTEIVIGMESGRFVPEIIDSIKTFCDKVNSGELILNRFIESPNAKNMQLAMLAGGYGSRAEYTNASSDRIFHGKKDGAVSTKGIFRTATGFTPMETTFITLHNAGLLDCSKGNLGIGKNIKLYLNESGVNKGNGGFTVDLYNRMEREGRKYLAVFPNDAMSRMTEAVKKMNNLMNSGKAALAMIAKEVSSKDAKGNFGIMKIDEKNNEILEFAEKPKVIPEGYEKNKKCLTNTFQFAVSREAFKALSILEPYFPAGKGKEPRDWSKTYVPILMALTQNDNAADALSIIEEKAGAEKGWIPLAAVEAAKKALGIQKIIAIPTDEPWADCGTLNQLYHTTMQIASNDFKLEDFERKHVLDSINTKTGLIASTPEQKAEIEDKYAIDGQVMAVPAAKKVNQNIVNEYKKQGLITINPRQK